MLGSGLSIYAFRRHEPCCLALIAGWLMGENMKDGSLCGGVRRTARGPEEGASELHAESCEVISVVPIFPAFPAFQAPFRLLALHPPLWVFSTGNRGNCWNSLLRCCFFPTIPTDTSLRDTPIPSSAPTQPTPRASATKPAVPPFALPAARRHPVTILSICAFLSVPILSYFFLAPNGTTTTLSYITYTESSAPPLRLHLSRVLFYQEVVLLLNSLYIQKNKDSVLTMSMFSQFSFRPLDEVPKPRIHTDSDYNSPTPSTGIDSPAKFDDPYDSDEFLEHHSSRSSLSLSRSWSRPKSRDSIPEEDEENEGQVSSLSVLMSFWFCDPRTTRLGRQSTNFPYPLLLAL